MTHRKTSRRRSLVNCLVLAVCMLVLLLLIEAFGVAAGWPGWVFVGTFATGVLAMSAAGTLYLLLWGDEEDE